MFKGFLTRLKQAFRGEEPPSPEMVEQLRRGFKDKYHAFRMLLAANNATLQIMTEMEVAAHGQQSFGMTFVRGHCTAACVNVFAIIRSLNELSGQKYPELVGIFEGLQAQIETVLTTRYTPPLPDLVLPFAQITKEMADGVGSKMANLGEIVNRLPNLAVPEGFAITSTAYQLFLTHNQLQEEINRRLQALEMRDMADLYRVSSEIQMAIIGAQVPPELAQAITSAYQDLTVRAGGKVRVALRSSAVGEDALETSFAGQYRSELNVSEEHLLTVFKDILASKYALTAVNYRLHKGLRDEDVPMCVGCMRMVEAKAGGVMYSRDPNNIRSDTIVINAVHGLAKAVVDGTVTPDLFVVSRDPLAIVHRDVRHKQQRVLCLPEEGVYTEADPDSDRPALTDAQILQLAQVALDLEEHFGSPQDVEWSYDAQGRLLLLQSRPLQQMAAPAEGTPPPADVDNPVLLRGGERASPGAACGPAYLVRNNLDLLQFPEGAVLLAATAQPAWATLLPRAVAVVTDRGGITGHLANVAREFTTPALFNTGDATAKIAPGTLITVDADGLTIYEGRVEPILAASVKKDGLMVGTPVHETLKEAMAFITPLNLTNPEAPDFKPRGCRTLHDITRFAHEVSVKEMFAFDQHRHVYKYFIKKLVADVPMEWWVLNLEDGFKEEVAGKEVALDNIASVPMLALWEGINAVPWEGPPPVDAKGFMSIVMGAATDPNLATAGDTVYGNQNYFMISKYFCNLTSRLGFHFSTVEALTGEQPYENYLRFTFKGGAADQTRRTLRARLVGMMLEHLHFTVDVQEDALFARLEGEPQDFMLDRLKALGYLTIHTRQIDMVMLNDSEVEHYREKMLHDLKDLVKT